MPADRQKAYVRQHNRGVPTAVDGLDVLAAARARVARLYDQFDRVVVHFSGGKDSTVVRNLCLEEAERRGRLPLEVVHYDEEAVPYETEDYVRRCAQDPRMRVRWFCLPVKHRNACSASEPYWYPWDPRIPEKWTRPMPPEAEPAPAGFRPFKDRLHLMNMLLQPAPWPQTVFVLGIRGQESLMRLRGVLGRKGGDPVVSSDTSGWEECEACGPKGAGKVCVKHTPAGTIAGLYKAWPIYDWKTEDVWRAIHQHGWDYNAAYDRMLQAGVAAHHQRCSPPYGEEPLEGLWRFKTLFPELWERMIDRVPGSATAARYARTPLYAFHGLPPSTATPQEQIARYVQRFPADVQPKVVAAVRAKIAYHFSKTGDALAPTAPHPLTGLSWRLLVKIAVRGNLKGRQSAMIDASDRAWARYRDEMARVAQGEAIALVTAEDLTDDATDDDVALEDDAVDDPTAVEA